MGLLPGEPPAAARCLSCAPVWPWQAAFDTYDHGCIGTGRWGHPTLKPSPLGTHIRFPLASRRWGTVAVMCVYFQTHPHAPMPEEALTFRRQDCWGSTRRGSAGDVPHRPAWKAPRSPGTLSGRLSIPVPWERSRLKAPTLLPRSSKDLGLLLFLTRRLGGRISRGSSGPQL